MVNVAINAQQLSKQDDQFVDSLMNTNYKPDKPGAVLLIAKKGKVVFKKAYGLASIELNVPNKTGNIFRIGSMSKQFTAVCILQLAQQGRLNLKDDIKQYLPAYNTHGRHITIENLLTHTSGILDPEGKPDFPERLRREQSHDDLINSFMNDSLLFEPGTDWHYSNANYALAGLIIENIAKVSLSEYLQEYIFNPIGMSHTSIGNNDSIVVNAVYGYTPLGEDKFQPSLYMNWSLYFGAGEILSTVDDLLKWDNALYTDKILKKEWLQKAWTPFILTNGQTSNYGFGWTTNDFHEMTIISHNGGINGFFSDGIRIPSQQTYIVLLSNNPSKEPWSITKSIALRFIGQKILKPLAITPDAKELQKYTGVYAFHHVNAAQEYLLFSVENDTLYAESPGRSKTALLNVGNDLFAHRDENWYYQYHRDKSDSIISIEAYSRELIQYGPHLMGVKSSMPFPKPKEKKEVAIDTRQISILQGKYDFGGGIVVPVTLEGSHIYIQQMGHEKEEIFAEDDRHFFSKSSDLTIEFGISNNIVTEMIVVSGGTYKGKKFND